MHLFLSGVGMILIQSRINDSTYIMILASCKPVSEWFTQPETGENQRKLVGNYLEIEKNCIAETMQVIGIVFKAIAVGVSAPFC